MRGLRAKRERKLGLRAGPVKREPATGAQAEAILERIVRTRLARTPKHHTPGALEAAVAKRERRARRNQRSEQTIWGSE